MCKALGAIDENARPPLVNFPNWGIVPQTGEVMRWEEIGVEHKFVVTARVFTYGADRQSMNVRLTIDLYD